MERTRRAPASWYTRARTSRHPTDEVPLGGGCKSLADNFTARGYVDATLSPFTVARTLRRIP